MNGFMKAKNTFAASVSKAKIKVELFLKDYARSEPRLKVVSSSQLLNSETKAWAKILKLFIKGSRPRLSKKLAQSLENLYLFCQAMAQKESLCSVWSLE